MAVINLYLFPQMAESQVQEVDYGTFVTMTENHTIGKVQIKSNQIMFTNKDESKIYKTGLIEDPDLVNRLQESGAEYSSEIIEQASPLQSLIFNWILPIIIFFLIFLNQFLCTIPFTGISNA